MIFSKLFRPKYRHDDPAVRIKAIESLSPDVQEQKSILHELAFNDSDDKVSIAALEKLHNFDLWWKMANIGRSSVVAKRSMRQVMAELTAPEPSMLKPEARRLFLLECTQHSLLQDLLDQNAIDLTDTDLVKVILAKLNKPQLNLNLMLASTEPAFYQALFAPIDDPATLQKIVKKAKADGLKQLAQARLAEQQEREQQAQQLDKEVRLQLSKLLALKERNDFQDVQQRADAISQGFQSALTQFDLLPETTAQELQDKYQQLQQKVGQHLAGLETQWQQEQAKLREGAALQEAKDSTDALLAEVNNAVGEQPDALTEQQTQAFKDGLSGAQQKLQKLLETDLPSAEHKSIESRINQLLQCQTQLDTLPALQVAIVEAKTLLEQFAQLPVPADVSQIDAANEYLQDQQRKWKDIKRDFSGLWPTGLQQQWQSQKQAWQSATHELNKQLKEQVRLCRNKLRNVADMMDKGKFHGAIRQYERALQAYEALPDSEQGSIKRQFEKVKDGVENLKDWQAYIAAPRKPALLEAIQQLAKTPEAPEEQARQVKALRQQWNSLGKLDTEDDSALNAAFDSACEAAFEPCRAHYAELEQQREENLKLKLGILEGLQQAVAAETPLAELAKTLRNQTQAWKNVGDVDYERLDELNQRYREVVEPIRSRVNQFYQDNAEQKQKLLQKAQALLNEEDWQTAVQEAKSLQEQWRQIDHAGQRQEKQLWGQFREVNDSIFARRNDAVAQEKSEQLAAFTELETRISDLSQQVKDAEAEQPLRALLDSTFTPLEDAVNEFSEERGANGKKSGKKRKLSQMLQQAQQLAQDKLKAFADYGQQQQYQQLWQALSQWTQQEPPELSQGLPNTWRQAFYADPAGSGELADLTRQQLLILLELQAGIASPEQEERKALQLKLMTLKLEQGTELDNDELLRTWIAKGSLAAQDQGLLPRLQAVFSPAASSAA